MSALQPLRPTGARMLVRLKYVCDADFRKSEATNYRALPDEIRDGLRDGEAVCFKSHSGDQVVFVVKPRTLASLAPSRSGEEGKRLEVFCSVRLRLPHSRTWNPSMLGEYADAAGLELIGIKRLNEHLVKSRLVPDDEALE